MVQSSVFKSHQHSRGGIISTRVLQGGRAAAPVSALFPQRISDRRALPAGFTLVELLVVIAIIGILIALLIPAVQAEREEARRAACSNHFKQASLACQTYASARSYFPSGLDMWGAGTCADPAYPASSGAKYGFGWAVLILPYMDEKPLYEAFNFDKLLPAYNYVDYTFPANYKNGANYVETYICPSEPKSKQLISCCSTAGLAQYRLKPNGGSQGQDLAVTHMAGVSDSRKWACKNGSDSRFWHRTDADGLLFQHSNIKPGKVKDGTSKTLMIGEVVTSPDADSRGFFYSSWDVWDTHNGINTCLRDYKLFFQDDDTASFASFHPRGCNFAFADGSVHYLSETIDQTVLTSLTTRDAGDTSSTAAF